MFAEGFGRDVPKADGGFEAGGGNLEGGDGDAAGHFDGGALFVCGDNDDLEGLVTRPAVDVEAAGAGS